MLTRLGHSPETLSLLAVRVLPALLAIPWMTGAVAAGPPDGEVTPPPAPPIACEPTPAGQGGPLPPGATEAHAGGMCLVCPNPVGGGDLAVVHRGRTVTVHRGPCWEAWQRNRANLFASLQPRGALFQESDEPPSPLKGGWFLFGLYVVAGLVFGAACGYIAVHRGLPPIPWFFVGLATNIVGLVIVLTRPARDLSRLPAGVPRGLVKVPLTRAPVSCPACGAPNHPSAKRCSSCRSAMSPTVESELNRGAGGGS